MQNDPRDRQPIPRITDEDLSTPSTNRSAPRGDVDHQTAFTLGGPSDGGAGALHDDHSDRPTSRASRSSRSPRSHRPSRPSGPGDARGDAGCSVEGGRTQRVPRAADTKHRGSRSGLSRGAANPYLGPSHAVLHKLSSRDVERAPTSSLWSRLETARNLLKDGPFDRQAKCQWVRRVAKTEDIELRRHSSGTYTVHGLVRCGHWTCPSCGPQRARATAGALGVAIERHLTPPERVKVPDPAHVPAHALDAPPMVFLDGGEYTPSANDVWMLTLSPPHYADEHVVDVVDRLFKATEAFFRSSVWRRFAERWGIAKRVRVLDATHGGPNGSHPHFHVALFPTSATIPRGRLHAGYEVSGPLRKNETRAWVPVEDGWMPVPLRTANKATREKWLTDDVRTDELIDAWKKAFLSAGGRIEKPTEFRTHALTLSPSENAAAYFTKWGLADEVGSPTAKSNTHLRLLDAVRSGIDAAGDAFIAWREAVDGKQWVSQLGDVCHLFEITGDDVRAYLERLRVKRDAELARRGETPVRVEPLAVKVRPHLYAGVLAVGWPEVFARLDEIAERASSPELVQLEFEGYLWRARVEAKRERHIEQEFRAAGVPEPTGFGDELRDAYERAIGGA